MGIEDPSENVFSQTFPTDSHKMSDPAESIKPPPPANSDYFTLD